MRTCNAFSGIQRSPWDKLICTENAILADIIIMTARAFERVKLKVFILLNLVVFFLALTCGCESEMVSNPFGSATDVLKKYAPKRIHIIGLSEIVSEIDSRRWPKIRAYVDLLDEYGSRVKSPATFRFELYEFAPRTSRSKGTRILAWDDFELNSPAENNSHWQDHLRAYEFELYLDFEPADGKEFILEVMCITPNGKRLIGSRLIRYQK